VDQNWGSGASNTIVITNNGSTPINTWNVSFAYSGSTSVSGHWDAIGTDLSAPSYAFENASWNGTIQPGQTKNFGLITQNPGAVPAVTVSCE
jgi:hypothetical protein